MAVLGLGFSPPNTSKVQCANPLGVNVGFRRPDAALHVVFISDGDDESGDVLGDHPVDAFLGLLAAEESRTGRAARASAVVGDVPDGCTGDDGAALPPWFVLMPSYWGLAFAAPPPAAAEDTLARLLAASASERSIRIHLNDVQEEDEYESD